MDGDEHTETKPKRLREAVKRQPTPLLLQPGAPGVLESLVSDIATPSLSASAVVHSSGWRLLAFTVVKLARVPIDGDRFLNWGSWIPVYMEETVVIRHSRRAVVHGGRAGAAMVVVVVVV